MLKKDLLELCLLHLLTKGDQYGYELLRQLHDAFPDTQESAIYAVLRGLCQAECTQWYQGKTSGGPARKYYSLTQDGTARHARLLEEWRNMYKALSNMGIG